MPLKTVVDHTPEVKVLSEPAGTVNASHISIKKILEDQAKNPTTINQENLPREAFTKDSGSLERRNISSSPSSIDLISISADNIHTPKKPVPPVINIRLPRRSSMLMPERAMSSRTSCRMSNLSRLCDINKPSKGLVNVK